MEVLAMNIDSHEGIKSTCLLKKTESLRII